MGIEVATVAENHSVIRQVNDTAGVVAHLAMTRWPKLEAQARFKLLAR